MWERGKTPSFKNHLAGTVCWTFDSLVLRREFASLPSFFYFTSLPSSFCFTYFFVLFLFCFFLFLASLGLYIPQWSSSLEDDPPFLLRPLTPEEAQAIYIYISCWKRRIPRRRLMSEGTFDEKWRWVDLSSTISHPPLSCFFFFLLHIATQNYVNQEVRWRVCKKEKAPSHIGSSSTHTFY